MFLSENAAALEAALNSGDSAKFNAALVEFLKQLAAEVDTLRLDIEEAGDKTENLVSNYEYINANMQVIKQAIVGDIKVETAEDSYLSEEDGDDCCHDEDCDCHHHAE